jgi:hypothetical protein
MKERHLIFALGVSLMVAIVITISNCGKQPDSSLSDTTCACALGTNVSLDSIVPGDAMLFGADQAACLAWQQFVALNWPTDGSTFGQAGLHPVQWERFIQKEVLFPANGEAPPPWSTALQARAEMFGAPANHVVQKVLFTASKFSRTFVDTSFQEAAPVNGPNWLGAQNGTNVWYEVLLNKDYYDFIVANNLYNVEGQEAFANGGKNFVFPSGSMNNSTVGAMELKAAWMEVDNPQDSARWSHYKLSEAWVRDPGVDTLRLVRLALVGLHVIHKMETQSSWFWTTFEQEDNVPDGAPIPGKRYNFFDASSTSKPNVPPTYNLGPGHPPTPIQVTREIPIESSVRVINQKVTSFLAQQAPNNVFSHYQLVNALWFTDPPPDADSLQLTPKNIAMATSIPAIPVANSVLETYVQHTTCISCHRRASLASNSRVSSDFSFAVGSASKRKK